jgi:hypothetical protein
MLLRVEGYRVTAVEALAEAPHLRVASKPIEADEFLMLLRALLTTWNRDAVPSYSGDMRTITDSVPNRPYIRSA